ncbi:hypothetical protein GALMADRAFT_1025317 [Galerina marginata CBS 339.88]|uniref:Uncharacterized protein n=1 Tax=Galerina marginata (strain CBS 339.88) TaxID=685588 RepID=A0A067SPK1_GALM3|nr:hypothetical protein GALMADRAFT_1025317 [Galerina marginata CBS 339.88]
MSNENAVTQPKTAAPAGNTPSPVEQLDPPTPTTSDLGHRETERAQTSNETVVTQPKTAAPAVNTPSPAAQPEMSATPTASDNHLPMDQSQDTSFRMIDLSYGASQLSPIHCPDVDDSFWQQIMNRSREETYRGGNVDINHHGTASQVESMSSSTQPIHRIIDTVSPMERLGPVILPQSIPGLSEQPATAVSMEGKIATPLPSDPCPNSAHKSSCPLTWDPHDMVDGSPVAVSVDFDESDDMLQVSIALLSNMEANGETDEGDVHMDFIQHDMSGGSKQSIHPINLTDQDTPPGMGEKTERRRHSLGLHE